MRETQEGEASQVELFLNSVPLLASLSREEKLALLDALDKQVFAPGVRVINQARLSQHTHMALPPHPRVQTQRDWAS